MGNSLTSSLNNNLINNSILGKEISKILREKQETIPNSGGKKPYVLKVNQARACCLGVVKPKPRENEFITVKLPNALDKNNPYCKSTKKCVGETKLGLQIKGDRNKMCEIKYGGEIRSFIKGPKTKCDEFIVNRCAKSLYDQGCIKCTDKKKDGSFIKCKPKWNTKNRNCFTKDGTLIYGPEECVCVNSQTGYTLNRNPSNTIRGFKEYKQTWENPYGIKGNPANDYTKYSLNLFDYDIAQQKPQIFDNRCANRIKSGSAASGKSIAYAIPDYLGEPSICMNMLKLGGNSTFGRAELNNIKQTNNCGAGRGPPPDIWDDLEKKKQREKAAREKAAREKGAKESGAKKRGNRIDIPGQTIPDTKKDKSLDEPKKPKPSTDKKKSTTDSKPATTTDSEPPATTDSKPATTDSEPPTTTDSSASDKSSSQEDKPKVDSKSKNLTLYIIIAVVVIVVGILIAILASSGGSSNPPAVAFQNDNSFDFGDN